MGKFEEAQLISNNKSNVNSPGYSSFPVVGIGASAGGLGPLELLLDNLPSDLGLGFVVIQHLLPGQPSMLTEILSRSTKMPVYQVENGIKVKPNTVYVTPPDKSTTITGSIGYLFGIICSSCFVITINCIGSRFVRIFGAEFFCLCFVFPIQYRLQPIMNVKAIIGAKRSMVSLLRFLLLWRFVISSPVTSCYLTLNI